MEKNAKSRLTIAIIRYYVPPLVCYALWAEFVLGEAAKFFDSDPDENIYLKGLSLLTKQKL